MQGTGAEGDVLIQLSLSMGYALYLLPLERDKENDIYYERSYMIICLTSSYYDAYLVLHIYPDWCWLSTSTSATVFYKQVSHTQGHLSTIYI